MEKKQWVYLARREKECLLSSQLGKIITLFLSHLAANIVSNQFSFFLFHFSTNFWYKKMLTFWVVHVLVFLIYIKNKQVPIWVLVLFHIRRFKYRQSDLWKYFSLIEVEIKSTCVIFPEKCCNRLYLVCFICLNMLRSMWVSFKLFIW